jgi:two-component system, sensor histidine kinase and response regulator
MKVLIADDDGAFRQMLHDILVKWGFEVVAVPDGTQALEVLRAEGGPRLAILDWSMPGLDGVELCRTIRSTLPEPYSYLMLLTSHQREEDVVAGMEAGADDYLTKPLSANQLRVRLNAGKRIVELQSQLLAAQESLTVHACELEAATKDLEAFSYAVANDILKSLLSIGDNSKAVQDLYCKEQDQQCRIYTHRIYEKTRGLAQLIGAMLDFFRPARREVRRERVNFSALAYETGERLRRADSQRAVLLTVEDGLVVQADKEMLSVALNNLLDNAWKHTRNRERAQVEVGKHQEQGESVFFVRDNGAGFDMAEAEKLFKPFHRLSGTEEYAGRGIGLATVARTIRRHGGRIWAEGEAGKGATFYFTLGKDYPG